MKILINFWVDEFQIKVNPSLDCHDHEASENENAFSVDENTSGGEMLETSVMIRKLTLICFPAPILTERVFNIDAALILVP